jgi:tetratricopeptide (TPR) repeat protein
MIARARMSREWLLSYLIIVAVITLGWFTVLSPRAETPAQAADAAKPMTLEQAEQTYKDASVLVSDLLWMRVDPYYHSGDWDRVIDLCYHAIDLDPTFIEPYNTGAWLLWSKLTPEGDKAAVALYDRGIKANPDDWEIALECGEFYYMIHKRDPKSAIPYLRHAAEAAERGAPDFRKVVILHQLGHALNRAGQPREALKVFKRAVEIDPTDAVGLKEIQKLKDAGIQ